MPIADFKEYSRWVCSKVIDGKQVWTVSGIKWIEMSKRCNPNALVHNKDGAYKYCENKFTDFNSFCDWHQQQIGYDMSWQLDKDILIRDNKIYSPETCVLLPQELNKLLIRSDKARGQYPIGVFLKNPDSMNPFAAQLSVRNKRKHLGMFKTPEDAFLAYKISKENLIKEMAEDWKGTIDNRVYKILMNYEVKITD
jgi:hypothetical protein